jgi:hypothetical protein
MPRVIPDELVEPVCGALLGAADVDGGVTAEQRAVLQAIVAGYWGRPDLDLDAVDELGPAGAASAVTDPAHRRRLRELMVLLELCRHPLTDAQVERVAKYAEALGESGPGLEIARTLVRDGAQGALADYQRHSKPILEIMAEPSLRGFTEDLPAPDPEIAARLHALHDLPAGTLGYEYAEFYRRNGFELPGDDVKAPAVFVAHDMCHVIGGYEPTGRGEIALGAMQLGVADTDQHWIGLLGNLGVHEAGYLAAGGLLPKEGTLGREGAADFVADAFRRGAECTGDFTTIDHLALAEVPLLEVREQFGVPPVGDGSVTHIG